MGNYSHDQALNSPAERQLNLDVKMSFDEALARFNAAASKVHFSGQAYEHIMDEFINTLNENLSIDELRKILSDLNIMLSLPVAAAIKMHQSLFTRLHTADDLRLFAQYIFMHGPDWDDEAARLLLVADDLVKISSMPDAIQSLMNQPTIYENIGQQLVTVIPEFKSVYEAHLKQNHGEVLNHLLMADLVRFTAGVCSSITSSRKPEDIGLLQRIASFIERAANSDDPRVVYLINVSFLEGLHQLETRQNYELLKGKLGQTTLKQLGIIAPVWLNGWLRKKFWEDFFSRFKLT